jgi:hypothetical protein
VSGSGSTTPVRAATPVLPGVAAGAASALVGMGLYQLVRLSIIVMGPTGAGGVDRFIGLLLLPALLSLGPCLVAGALLGGLVGVVLTLSWNVQSPVRAAVTGALVTAWVAGVINLAFVARHRRVPLTLGHWLHALGGPSVVFVLVFGAVGVWLYRNQLRSLEA